MEEAMEVMRTAILAVLDSANGLRRSTAANVMEILSPFQNVVFFAAATEFELRVSGGAYGGTLFLLETTRVIKASIRANPMGRKQNAGAQICDKPNFK
ncbi:unnamed protein product [Dovyalis caffra]|uniref:Uncharacterized protein n=1 Tax=Dovyalis caffra TaxID=77055 RepID=A0AAV1S7P6_9ROSI|nr:unnamed protein product [Dovyalis caffra]